MVVKEFVLLGSNEFNSVKYEMVNVEGMGTLIIFSEGGDQMNLEICSWVKDWVNEYSLKCDSVRMLEDLIVRVNDKLLIQNEGAVHPEYSNLSLVLIQKEKSFFVSFGGNIVVSCKKEIDKIRFTKGADFGSGDSRCLGEGEIQKMIFEITEEKQILEKGKIEIKDRKVLKTGRGINTIQFRKQSFPHRGTERILLFGSEYGNLLQKYEIDLHGFINKNIPIDEVSEHIQRSLNMYVANRKSNKIKFNTLSGIVIEIER